ncbi:hypothetical protein ACS3UN_00505 [Oscillospiraceae bacterium LTW-04]|nr:hypothetical protein RBH76_09930 [Oscillospiraceae bacterium MB24-C1]
MFTPHFILAVLYATGKLKVTRPSVNKMLAVLSGKGLLQKSVAVRFARLIEAIMLTSSLKFAPDDIKRCSI